MIKSLQIWFLCSLFSSLCWSQHDFRKNDAAKSGAIKNNAESEPITVEKDTVIAPKLLPDVLFATNEDCDLYVNEEWKGPVSKSEFRYLKLAPGNYIYKAKSKATFDELKETFTVTESGMNEVFMDLLYLVDEKNMQRESFKNRIKATLQPLVLNEKKTLGSKPEERRMQINKEAEITAINDLTGSMILINGGTFVMGNNKAPSPDEVEHPVTINTVFFSKYEVSQLQWERIMGYNFSLNKGCSTCPAENISWEEAMKFIRKINVISSKKFRLPREAEWEYVARMGGKTEIENAGGQEEYIKKTTWYFGNSAKKTHPVGMKQPNVSDVYDLLGNVSEWCSDWYDSYYYKEDFNQIDPEGPPLGKEKVIRGGNFNDYSGDRFRPSLRNKKIPTGKSGDVGIRLVLELN